MMTPFPPNLTAIAAPIALPNVDTDQIIPARYLWRPRAAGYGDVLFNDLRFLPDGTLNPDFVLNAPRYSGAQIIIAERNFGCGSSREQAVWALADYGIRAVVAPSFGDIFFNNCFKQGMLPITLPEPDLLSLRDAITAAPGEPVTIDLAAQTITGPAGWHADFTVAAFRRRQLLEGLDEISFTLSLTPQIAAFEAQYDHQTAWL
jgi:3-isopropylmalate/(R)-2-methylmalate dehydratase small subunit